ncbi:peptide ABC transporter ATP-binding protein [Sporanaerobium hydrogeniformans]|uniref:Peptide ABC transporter ATP-binding protein n=1 Tax=Sporanaerobium hydrogeniformans TaxID=3072179 RepID=A0AC61DHC7_9FIRM|nr:ABC transporter ATP-binding protein [Sporanaerobium hydrogeniformans]PHV72265.1 peptide ABC transporter ATP-binding protein [Sporanaerobium hydrogeniformans]
MSQEKLLEVRNLKTSFFTHLGEVQSVRDVSFDLYKGEVLGVVGESGSGKSVTCSSVMHLLSEPGKIKEGTVLFKGDDLVKKSEKEMRRIQGNEISMIFQDPMSALNPVYTIGNQMMEVIRTHKKINHKEAEKLAIEMLRLVGIPSPEERIHNYPHEFSGGMRQRAMIAMALSCDPELLIADEPTTALDVTIQAQILDLMKDIRERLNTSIIFITHDLGVIAQLCTRVIVMYGGMIMEEGTVEELFHSPQNPYTMGLLNSVPNPDSVTKERLEPIPGSPPDLLHPPKGCPFCKRCPYAMNKCLEELPAVYTLSPTQKSRCHMLHPEAPAHPAFQKGGKN